MSKLKRMKPILGVAQEKEQQAKQDLSKAKNQLNEQEQQLTMLEQYRGEYHQNLQQTGLNGMMAADLQRYYQFINHLNQAIDNQQDVVNDNQRDVDVNRDHLISANKKKEILNILVENLEKSELKAAEKNEQKEVEQMQQSKHSREKGS